MIAYESMEVVVTPIVDHVDKSESVVRAVWIDGKLMAHHKAINWRSSDKLKLNAIWLMLYVTQNSAKRNKVNTVWFDDVVVATEYIGPPTLLKGSR